MVIYKRLFFEDMLTTFKILDESNVNYFMIRRKRDLTLSRLGHSWEYIFYGEITEAWATETVPENSGFIPYFLAQN